MTEDGSGLADDLWAASESRISSQLIYPEACAALATAARARRIDSRALRRAVGDLNDATASMRLIGVDAALARAAGQLAEEHSLRGYDAVHLATALCSDDRNLLVVTWDRDLGGAALQRGLAVAPALRA